MKDRSIRSAAITVLTTLFCLSHGGPLRAAGEQVATFPESITSRMLEACQGKRSCFMALDGKDRELCEAYKEDNSCAMSFDGADRGWCDVLKEGKSCFVALDGKDRYNCENDIYPAKHLFWAGCSDLPGQYRPDIMDACRGKRSCFMALNGRERGLCEAYKEDKSCLMALNGKDRNWCELVKEGKSCFFALDLEEQEACRLGWTPREHRFWKGCAADSLEDGAKFSSNGS